MTRNEAIIAETQDEIRARRSYLVARIETANLAQRAISLIETHRDSYIYKEDAANANLLCFAIYELHETLYTHRTDIKRLHAEIERFKTTLQSLGAKPTEPDYPLPQLETIR